MASKLKFKLKSFFKTKDTSEAAVELFRMFITPFMKLWMPDASPDDVISAFFAAHTRKFFNGTAVRGFRMPGAYMRAGNLPSRRAPVAREVSKGHKMFFAVDQKEQNARVDITIEGKYCTFLLTRAELEFLKDCIEAKET